MVVLFEVSFIDPNSSSSRMSKRNSGKLDGPPPAKRRRYNSNTRSGQDVNDNENENGSENENENGNSQDNENSPDNENENENGNSDNGNVNDVDDGEEDQDTDNDATNEIQIEPEEFKSVDDTFNLGIVDLINQTLTLRLSAEALVAQRQQVYDWLVLAHLHLVNQLADLNDFVRYEFPLYLAYPIWQFEIGYAMYVLCL